ncbi:tRNA modification GTPase TrmE [Chlorobium limicola DSM 245]|uniref:tRNA modification GTPase MnmE n=1 Tax=Chlorobium limicola (strain DSM 245 / NBRC 103803 / 6330) TaxID=290315 RepID=B3EHY7_CHLL2|nr:tRNA uridine-5-carboxymethylaminomethyl(34) synthesis GTPase MnmE [Chlorobium limicola]ACD91396.1 tRNA modification GTPase TrmE [Chlorobium limicola DSM 245]
MPLQTSQPVQEDPIAAIATPLGVGALAVIRISGSGVLDIAQGLFRKSGHFDFQLRESKGFTAHFGRVYDRDGLVDEVIALVFRSPNSYTREDMVEFSCHGGPVVVRHMLQALYEAGCRPAEPGEFTRRAFINGRIDLLQAEAIGEMIHARSESAYRTAVNQMQGNLSMKLEQLRQRLLESCAMLELELDFSEEDVEFQSRGELREQLMQLQAEVQKLVDSYQHGRLLSEGVATVIVGKPNAGKSTLLNTLLGEERAIVSHMPGTTRDYIEECFVHEKTMFRLTDTAGLREAAEEIEREGVGRSYKKIGEADLILYMLDLSQPESLKESEVIREFRETYTHAKLIVIANKTDLASDSEERLQQLREETGCDVAGISAKQGEGIDGLLRLMSSMVEGLDKLHDASVLVTSLRHYVSLRNAGDAVRNALELLGAYAGTELIAFELRSALDYVGEITGKVVSEEVLNVIFDRFCVGK